MNVDDAVATLASQLRPQGVLDPEHHGTMSESLRDHIPMAFAEWCRINPEQFKLHGGLDGSFPFLATGWGPLTGHRWTAMVVIKPRLPDDPAYERLPVALQVNLSAPVALRTFRDMYGTNVPTIQHLTDAWVAHIRTSIPALLAKDGAGVALQFSGPRIVIEHPQPSEN